MKFLILALFSFNAFAITQSECGSMDIREKNRTIAKNQALKEHFSTPRNQDSLGWCYAFAAADLISAEVGQPVSSLHASLIFNTSLENSNTRHTNDRAQKKAFLNNEARLRYIYEGGSLSASLKTIIAEKQVCYEKNLPFDNHKGKTTIELLMQLESLKMKIDARNMNEFLICGELNRILPEFGLYNLTADNIEVAEKLIDTQINAAMEQIVESSCKKQIQLPPIEVRSLLPNPNYMKDINTMVSTGKAVAINYDIKDVTAQSGRHVNLITGRRWNNGRCEYKLRNTWGKSCSLFNPGIDCIKEEGSFWVPEEFVRQKTTAATYLMKK